MLKRKNRPARTNCFPSERPPKRPSIKYVLAVSLAMLFIPIRSAMSQFVPPGVPVAGKAMSEWIEPHAMWAFSAPPNLHVVITDESYAHLGQDGPVWFIGIIGWNGEKYLTESSIAVPAGKHIFFPNAFALEASDENDPDLAARAQDAADGWQEIRFEVDGSAIPSEELLTSYRFSSGAFHYDFPAPNFAGLTERISGYAAIDGTFVMLEPLPPGVHTIRSGSRFTNDDSISEFTRQIYSFDDPADFNFDGNVDSVDQTAQTTNWTGASMLGVGERMLFIDGDTDFDGDIDTADQTILIQNWTGPMAGDPGDGKHAKLIYDPATGHVTLDATDTPSGKIRSFAMANAKATDWYKGGITDVDDMSPENVQFPFSDTGTNTDGENLQIGQSDATGSGAGPTIALGEILPAGLGDVESLSDYLTLAEYASDLGVGGALGLIVQGEGDFDADRQLTAQDIDLLSPEITKPEPRIWFDLNFDGLVDGTDRDVWMSLANTSYGDADLNGTVEFADFLSLSANFGQAGGWAEGDFDGSGDVQFADFLLLSSNFGQTAGAAATVPEPGPFVPILVLTAVVSRLRRRRCLLGCVAQRWNGSRREGPEGRHSPSRLPSGTGVIVPPSPALSDASPTSLAGQFTLKIMKDGKR